MKLSIVIPIFNEEECLPELTQQLEYYLKNYQYEVIFVNDGSSDKSLELLKGYATKNSHFKIVNLSRNFGHQPALTAGLSFAKGDAIVLMDGDLQDPPEIIPDMVKEWEAGNKVVIALRRRREEKFIRKIAFRGFYKALGFLSDFPISLNAGIFGLLDWSVVEEIKKFPERNRFIPGIRSWVGFRQITIFYDRVARYAGEPKQTFGQLLRYAFDAIFSFSYKPLRLALVTGFTISILSLSYAFLLFIFRIIGYNIVPGFTTTAMAILIMGGIQLLSIGILGEYLGRVYDEVKSRPYFIVSDTINMEDESEHLIS